MVIKSKKPTKAETARKLNERAIASATKKVATLTLDEARTKFLDAEVRGESFRNVYAVAMNAKYAFTLEDHGIHWSVIISPESKNAQDPSSNMHPVWKELNAERDGVIEFLDSKAHSNSRQVFKRVRERAFEIAFPGKKRPPRNNHKLPADTCMERLIQAYRAVAKEAIQTERDEMLVNKVGELLIHLKVDLAAINAKLG